VRRSELLHRVDRALARLSRVALSRSAHRVRTSTAGYDLSQPAVSLLATLVHSGPARQRELVRAVNVDAPLVSRELRILVDEGLVEREGGRMSAFHATEEGDRVYQRIRAAADAHLAGFTRGWTNADLTLLADLLERLLGDALAARPGPTRPLDGRN
jgi:DNA-binding MarR family transcriptional regulator